MQDVVVTPLRRSSTIHGCPKISEQLSRPVGSFRSRQRIKHFELLERRSGIMKFPRRILLNNFAWSASLNGYLQIIYRLVVNKTSELRIFEYFPSFQLSKIAIGDRAYLPTSIVNSITPRPQISVAFPGYLLLDRRISAFSGLT